jgi:hypothetical protein
MRRGTYLAILGCLALAQASRGDDQKPEARPAPFAVEGLFSVDTPPGGFQWTQAQKMEIGGSKARNYACTKDGVARVVLTVEERTAKGDHARVATLKGHYNALVQTLTRGGFTDLKGTKPGLKAPIPDRSSFAVSGKNARGEQVFIQCVTVFGKNVYALQVFASSPEEADALAALAVSLKEPRQEKGK